MVPGKRNFSRGYRMMLQQAHTYVPGLPVFVLTSTCTSKKAYASIILLYAILPISAESLPPKDIHPAAVHVTFRPLHLCPRNKFLLKHQSLSKSSRLMTEYKNLLFKATHAYAGELHPCIVLSDSKNIRIS